MNENTFPNWDSARSWEDFAKLAKAWRRQAAWPQFGDPARLPMPPEPDTDHAARLDLLRRSFEEVRGEVEGAMGEAQTGKKVVSKVASKKVLDEAIDHLQRLVAWAMERELDWVALTPEIDGKPNPEYDPSYVEKAMKTPELVFSQATWEAKVFLNKLTKV